jgi:hypothetical protein
MEALIYVASVDSSNRTGVYLTSKPSFLNNDKWYIRQIEGDNTDILAFDFS